MFDTLTTCTLTSPEVEVEVEPLLEEDEPELLGEVPYEPYCAKVPLAKRREEMNGAKRCILKLLGETL